MSAGNLGEMLLSKTFGIICFKLKPIGDNGLDGMKLIYVAQDFIVTYNGRHLNNMVTFKLLTFILKFIPEHPCWEPCYIARG